MDMLAALWVAVDEQGRAVVYRELYEGRDNGKGEKRPGHIISALARAAGGERRRRGAGLAGSAGPVEPQAGHGKKRGGAVFGERRAAYKDGQQPCGRMAGGAGISGAGAGRQARGGEAAQTLRLRTSGPALCSETEAKRRRRPARLPRLRIFDTRANLIRTLPALRHDERKPEDAAVTPHELTHAPDALRGFCTYWSTAAHVRPRRSSRHPAG